MRIKETKLYTYAELSDSAKEKARDWYRNASAGDNFFAEHITDEFHETLKAFGFDPFETWRGNVKPGKRSTVAWSGFWNQGDGASFSGSWRASDFAPDALLADRPLPVPAKPGYVNGNEEVHRIAAELRACVDAGMTFASIEAKRGFFMSMDSHCMAEDTEDACAPNGACERFIEAARDLATGFYRALEAEYEYQNSDECVAESIEANGYEFTEEGERA